MDMSIDLLSEIRRSATINTYDENRKNIKESLNNMNTDKEELVKMLQCISLLQEAVKEKFNNIEENIGKKTIAYCTLKKEGNKKYIHFEAFNVLLNKVGNKVIHKSTGKTSDMLISEVFQYKKTDKKTIKDVQLFKEKIINEYEIYNIDEFNTEFNKIIA